MKYRLLTTIAILAVSMTSCNKEKVVSNNSNNDPISLIAQTLLDKDESDFTVLVTSSLGISLLTTNSLDKTSTVVMAYEKDFKDMGSLTVNNISIPFDSTHYFLQSDSTQLASDFIGKINEYDFTSINTNEFPNFTKQYYSPNTTLLTFEGIVDNTLPRSNNLIINWTNDNNVALNSIIIIYGADTDGANSKLIYKIPTSNSSSITFTNSELSVFSNYERIGVYYARGYESVDTINNKTTAFQFMNYSNATIYFQ